MRRILPQVMIGIAGTLAYHLVYDSTHALINFFLHMMLWWTFSSNLSLAKQIHDLMARSGVDLVSSDPDDADQRPMGDGYPYYWLLPGLLYLAAVMHEPLTSWCDLILWLDSARLVLHLIMVGTPRASMKHRLRLIEDPEYRRRFDINWEQMGYDADVDGEPRVDDETEAGDAHNKRP